VQISGTGSVELALDHRMDEVTHPIAKAGFDWIKPVVEKVDSAGPALAQTVV
jgi:hypothetical protein